jgi:hypothetical protein
MNNLILNIVKCAKCDDVIESQHRHDFVMCSCGAIYTDGGHDYVRRGGILEDMIEISQEDALAWKLSQGNFFFRIIYKEFGTWVFVPYDLIDDRTRKLIQEDGGTLEEDRLIDEDVVQQVMDRMAELAEKAVVISKNPVSGCLDFH